MFEEESVIFPSSTAKYRNKRNKGEIDKRSKSVKGTEQNH